MKADGGALIYVILAIISIIVSVIGKNKNKRVTQGPSAPQPVTEEPSEDKPRPSWQKELEDIFGNVINEPEVIVRKTPPRESKPFEPITTEIVTGSIGSKTKEEGKYIETSKTGPIDSTTIHTGSIHLEEEHEPATVTLEEFELSKAVIYSEILNRKYF